MCHCNNMLSTRLSHAASSVMLRSSSLGSASSPGGAVQVFRLLLSMCASGGSRRL